MEVVYMAKHHPKGLDGRARNDDGEIRRKRGDTEIGTLRKELGPNFASDYRADTKLDTVRKDYGVDSLDQLRKKLK